MTAPRVGLLVAAWCAVAQAADTETPLAGGRLGMALLRLSPAWLPLGQPAMPRTGADLAPLPPEVDPVAAERIADVVAVAKARMDGLALGRPASVRTHGQLPGLGPAHIRLVVGPGRPWHENVVTDRQGTIYVRLGNEGIGDAMRGDAGPVAVLCESVAELYNSWRLPGLNRYLAHAYLAPAVVEQLGPSVLPTKHPTPLGPDGPEMLDAVTREEYTRVHPDLAATAAIKAVEETLGLEGLSLLLESLPTGAEDPFAAFRAAALKADDGLEGVFAPWDEAHRLTPEADGSYLVTSFEPDEAVPHIADMYPLRSVMEILWFDTTPDTEWSFSTEWSSDGERSLELRADEKAGWMALYIRDPDWQFRDLRRFGAFELDLMLDAAYPQPVSIRLNDHVSDGHGELHVLDAVVRPGEERHVVYEFTEANLQGQRDVDATYFSGRFRADSAARLYVGLGKPRQPLTLYVDNIRFAPRT
jgi:hypothetical protein